MSSPNSLMDRFAAIWLWLGQKFGVRPATVIGVTIGAILFATALTYILVQQNNTERDVREVTAAFCNGSDPQRTNPANQERCNDLLRTLLKNPDPDNARRLREITENQ